MKVVFLDIDGVLNSLRSFTAVKSPTFEHQDQWVFVSADPIACKLIDRLVDGHDLNIVISSSHRLRFFTGKVEYITATDDDLSGQRWEHRLSKLQTYLEKIGLQQASRVIGCTPEIPKAIRGQEIEAWLACHLEVTHYAIIDNNSDMTDQQKAYHFVQTSTNNGFSFENYQQVEKIMKGPTVKQLAELYYA